MNAVTFDTLRYSNQLEQAGITRAHDKAQAKVQQESLLNTVMKDLARKIDVTALKKDSDTYKTDIAFMKWGIGMIIAMNVSMMLKMFFG